MRIKEILKEKGMTQQELAERLGVSYQSIKQTLNATSVTTGTLERIANSLDVPMWQLFASPKEVSNIKGNNIEINCPHCNKIISLSIEIKDNDF